jgi:hypothetical protein
MTTDEERIRQEIAGAVVHTGAPLAPPPRPPATGPPPPVKAEAKAPPRPRSSAPVLLAVLGMIVLLLSLAVISQGGQIIGGLVGVLIGVVLIVGGLIVEAITQLRVDLWRARQ